MYADANRAIKIKKGTYLFPKVKVERYLHKKGRRKKPRIYQPTTQKRAQSSVYQQSLGRATFLVHPTKFVKSAYFITHFPNSIRKFNYEFKGWGWRKDLRIRQYNQTLQDLQNTVRKFQFSFIKANKYKKKRIYLKKFKKKYGGTSKRFKKLNKYATSS